MRTVILAVMSTACVSHSGGRIVATSSAPTCRSPSLAWSAEARRDANDLLVSALRQPFTSTPLSIGGFADGANELILVLAPDIPYEPGDFVRRAADVPAPPAAGELSYWKVQVHSLHADGVLYVREQGTLFPGGRASRIVALACGAYVRGVPMFTEAGGFGN